ncbi:HAMP domain-containing histidine kinase [Ligilactobacillus equi]|uniref:HAMP domain-containing sensor histidine kinase n=1 Tax=Ligilactobacillus equi TaxID=137357 RepID=UPI002ED2E468
MKIFYQQVLAFFTVILTLLVILGFSFFHLMKENVYRNTWFQLENYAHSLKSSGTLRLLEVDDSRESLIVNQTKLESFDELLQGQGVHMTIYTKRDEIIYPNNAFKASISKKEWKKLKQGKIIYRKFDIAGRRVKKKMVKPTTNLDVSLPEPPKKLDSAYSTERQQLTDIFVPCFNSRKELVAVISLGSIASNIKEAVTAVEVNLLYALLISAALGLIVSFILAHYMTKKIRRLQSATKQIADGNFDVAIKNRGKDELDELAHDFNRMASSLAASNKEIERQEELRLRFMADAAHEMRTPLTTINGILEGLAYDVIPEESKEKSITLMQNETKRLIRLVNENLDYEKIRSGVIVLNQTELNASEIIKNIAKQLEAKAQENNDCFELALPDELPIYADYDRLVQIVFNITQNAIQFTQNGTIGFSGERGYRETVIRIYDTGIGMTSEQVQNIWERYYKADPSRTNKKYGESGLGLSIVKQLVDLHQAQIEVQSQVGKGTTFTMTFPDKQA